MPLVEWRALALGVLLLAWLAAGEHRSPPAGSTLARVGFPPQVSERSAAELLADGQLSIVLVKTYKCASSTTAGIVANIADRRQLSGGRLVWDFAEPPGVSIMHAPAAELGARIASSLGNASYFFLTFVREPLARCQSHFYMQQVRYGWRSDWQRRYLVDGDAGKIAWLRGCVGFYRDYLSAAPGAPVAVDQVLSMYNFVGVVERYDESLLVLRRLLGLSHWDLVYLAAKVTGDKVLSPRLPKYPPIDQSAAVRDYVAANWSADNQLDAELVARANQLLDQHIAAIGPSFDTELEAFRQLQRLVVAECLGDHRPALDCLVKKNGCGFRCFDAVEARMTGAAPSRRTPYGVYASYASYLARDPVLVVSLAVGLLALAAIVLYARSRGRHADDADAHVN